MHQSERDWAKKNAHKFADYYAKETGKTISDEEAYQKLLSAGYAMVDDTTSRTGGSDEKAKQFIGENKTAGLFDATPYERSQPLLGGNPDGSPTPEQQARTGTKNPTGVAQKLYGETLAASQKPCTDPYACGTKVDQVTAAVEALQQERALYQDDPAKRQQIEAQERQLLGGITSKEWQSAKLAQADVSTLTEVLAFVGAPVLAADITGALTRIGANGVKSGGVSVAANSGTLAGTGSAVAGTAAAVGKLIGSTDSLTSAERSFIGEMIAGGKTVEVIPSSNAGRSADFLIDGTKYELKTMTDVASHTSDGLSKAISSAAMDARGQSGDIIIDARNQPGMTPDIAQRGINRAFSADSKSGSKIQSITVITSQGTVYVPRLPQ